MSLAKKCPSRWWVWTFTILLWPIVADIHKWLLQWSSALEAVGEDPREQPQYQRMADSPQWSATGSKQASWCPLEDIGNILLFCSRLGGITPCRWDHPTLGWRTTLGPNAPKMGPHSTNCIVGHLTSTKGCQPGCPTILCNKSRQECSNEVCSCTRRPFILARKEWGLHVEKGSSVEYGKKQKYHV